MQLRDVGTKGGERENKSGCNAKKYILRVNRLTETYPFKEGKNDY
jgi:hypothetical protein